MNANQNTSFRAKIELVSCPQKCDNLRLILTDINRFFHESELYQHNKEYLFAIASLKKAFEKTFVLQDVKEQEYAKFLRSVITESLKSIQKDLNKMTSGFFRKKSYQHSLNLVKEALKEFNQEPPAGKLRTMNGPLTFSQIGNTQGMLQEKLL